MPRKELQFADPPQQPTLAGIASTAIEQLAKGNGIDEQMRELLGKMSVKAAGKLVERIDSGEMKDKDLVFVMAVSEDKRARLDGRSSLAGATVNLQINNINSRDGMLESLGFGAKQPIEVSATQVKRD